jgi:hypothetical protein
MKDYKLAVRDSSLLLTDYKLNTSIVPYYYNREDSTLVLHYAIRGDTFELTGKAINWKRLPALRKGIQWFSE